MIKAAQPALRSATHVVFDIFTSDRLLQVGATSVVCASDRLSVGPSRRDGPEHARAREAWWNSPETWDHLYSAELRRDPPFVLWASASLNDRLNLWRTCSWLHHLGVAARDVFILELEPAPCSSGPAREPEEPVSPFDCSSSVSDHADEVLLERLATARPWPRARYARALRLWDQYGDADPLRFVRSCTRGVQGFPELGPLWALLSRFFPRRSAGGTLSLSRFDELLLTTLSAEWQTPVKVFAHESQPGEELRQSLYCTGDLFLSRRLDHWANGGSSPAVERAPGPRPAEARGPMTSCVYRLTERGILLRAGLPDLADAPRLPVAGTEAYAPEAPWVLLDDGRLTSRP
jgi:hypothetical protein